MLRASLEELTLARRRERVRREGKAEEVRNDSGAEALAVHPGKLCYGGERVGCALEADVLEPQTAQVCQKGKSGKEENERKLEGGNALGRSSRLFKPISCAPDKRKCRRFFSPPSVRRIDSQ